MGFIVNKIGQTKKPDGHYLVKDGIEWLITDLSISASGYVSIKLHDPVRLENQIVKAGTIGGLAAKVSGFTYKEDL